MPRLEQNLAIVDSREVPGPETYAVYTLRKDTSCNVKCYDLACKAV